MTPEELAEQFDIVARVPTVYRIVLATAAAFDIEPSELLGSDRSKSVREGRQAAYLVARRCTRLSYPELGRAFGKDHTTVLAGVRSMASQCERDPGLAEIVDLLIERFGEVGGREREQ